jgi:solute carrier family 29 (equilibrative nucleoside transporter), member 4
MMEPTTEGSSYEPLEGRRPLEREATESPESPSTTPPKDNINQVYFALLTAGIGFVLPYNR